MVIPEAADSLWKKWENLFNLCSICGSYLLMGITEKIKTFTLKNLIMPLK